MKTAREVVATIEALQHQIATWKRLDVKKPLKFNLFDIKPMVPTKSVSERLDALESNVADLIVDRLK